MEGRIKVAVAVQVVVAALTAWFLFSSGAFERIGAAFAKEEAEPEEEPMPETGAANPSGVRSKAERGERTKRDDPDREVVEWLIASAVARSGLDEAEVDRRVAEILETKKRTIEVKRAEEERRVGEVVDWFDHLMAHHPESGQKAREIMNEYIDLRYATYGDMEDVDPEFARGQRESIRQRVGQRLMSELPPAQGATLLKRLFI